MSGDPDTHVEAVAKALFAIEWEGVGGHRRDLDQYWSLEDDRGKEYWRKSARAALAAIRALSDEDT